MKIMFSLFFLWSFVFTYDSYGQSLSFLDMNYALGKFNPDKHPDFIKIDSQYTNKSNIYLRKEVYLAFLKMYNAALKDGYKLIIISAARNFEYQKRIWDGKWKKEKSKKAKDKVLNILKYSAMPCSSRHHWGTDFDINTLEASAFENGKNKKIYDWMVANAHKYGFYQPYTKGRKSGYNEEKWHWTYLPTSKMILNYMKLNFNNNMITGFKGAETAVEIDILNNYILGINPECL
jgi:zinc D-Ala-D-Ala carboxypeptidase